MCILFKASSFLWGEFSQDELFRETVVVVSRSGQIRVQGRPNFWNCPVKRATILNFVVAGTRQKNPVK